MILSEKIGKKEKRKNDRLPHQNIFHNPKKLKVFFERIIIRHISPPPTTPFSRQTPSRLPKPLSMPPRKDAQE
jgi:hypothetical protein